VPAETFELRVGTVAADGYPLPVPRGEPDFGG
jgi:hypothetical protein